MNENTTQTLDNVDRTKFAIDIRSAKQKKSDFMKNKVKIFRAAGHNKSVAILLAKLAWKENK